MLVFDTSAYINGSRHHLPMGTFPSVWELIGEAMSDGRIISPRMVWTELKAHDDDLFRWAKDFRDSFIDPTEAVQREAGRIEAELPPSRTRGLADPWVIAEARIRELTVVTYEGQTFAGVPTRRWPSSMPGICNKLGVDFCTLPEALARLGASF